MDSNNGSLEDSTEEEKIREYLARGDTAVIFSEPVDSRRDYRPACSDEEDIEVDVEANGEEEDEDDQKDRDWTGDHGPPQVKRKKGEFSFDMYRVMYCR